MEAHSLEGKKFGKWLVLGRERNNDKGASMWLCQCNCGVQKVVLGTNLQLGRSMGCGKCRSEKNPSDFSRKKIYKSWKNMKQRCFYKKDKSYKDYGGRGITVCEAWKDSFESFFDYVSKLPHYQEEGYTLDRINNEGNYEPNNVRWATKYEQTHNRRKQH